MASGDSSAGAKKGVKSGDSKRLMEFLADEGVATRYNITFMGAIVKERAEEALEAYSVADRSKPAILGQTLHSVLDEMSDDTELFEKLLKSYPRCIGSCKSRERRPY